VSDERRCWSRSPTHEGWNPLTQHPAVPPFSGLMVDGSQVTDLQRDALRKAGVDSRHLYDDAASGKREDRPGLAACLKALREGDTLVAWKLDRLGCDLRHLVDTVHDLAKAGVGFKVPTGQGTDIDTTSPNGKLVFGIFAALADFEHALIVERTRAGMVAARARGRHGGRPYKMTAAKLRLAMAAMGLPETKVGEFCRELGASRQTLYRHVAPNGSLRSDPETMRGRKPSATRDCLKGNRLWITCSPSPLKPITATRITTAATK
jgi:DNA invertase Pin-like site-specific DNA recombinase